MARFNGVSDGTMMAGEAYGFYRLGLFIERADMSARILDVKYHILLPSIDKVGTPLDFYQWGALLKSLSGFEAYRRLHHTGINPIDVSDFVIFNPNFPRSLLFCAERMQNALDCIGRARADTDTDVAMNAVLAFLKKSDPQTAFQTGLHEFLQDFLRRVAAVTSAAQADFFEPNLGGPSCATSFNIRPILNFPSPVNEHQCEIRMTPRENEHQRLGRVQIRVEPHGGVVRLSRCVRKSRPSFQRAGATRKFDDAMSKSKWKRNSRIRSIIRCSSPANEHAWYEDWQ